MGKTKKVSRPAQGSSAGKKVGRIYAGGDNVRTSGTRTPQPSNNKPRRLT